MRRPDTSLKPETLVVGISFVALIAGNALIETMRLGGVTSADVSNEVFAWFAPAGYVFSIWSLIYTGVAVWAVRLIRAGGGGRLLPRMALGAEAGLFALSCVLNLAWLIAWHFEIFPATIVLIIALLVVVGMLYLMTRGRSRSWLDRTPMALYTSWLCVATVANIAHVVTRVAPPSSLIAGASTLMLLVGFVAVSYIVRRVFDDYVLGAVVAWAGIGIGVRLSAVSPATGVAAILISTIGVAIALIPWETVINKPGLAHWNI